MGKRGKVHKTERKPISVNGILRSLKIVNGKVIVYVSPHFIWQILSRKLVENLSEGKLKEILVDSYVITDEQRPNYLMSMLNNDCRNTIYFTSKRQGVTLILDEDITKKVCVARTAYASNYSLWVHEWIKLTPLESRISLSDMLNGNSLALDIDMPNVRRKKAVVDEKFIDTEVVSGNGFAVAYRTGNSDGWRLGRVDNKFSGGYMVISSDFGIIQPEMNEQCL